MTNIFIETATIQAAILASLVQVAQITLVRYYPDPA